MQNPTDKGPKMKRRDFLKVTGTAALLVPAAAAGLLRNLPDECCSMEKPHYLGHGTVHHVDYDKMGIDDGEYHWFRWTSGDGWANSPYNHDLRIRSQIKPEGWEIVG